MKSFTLNESIGIDRTKIHGIKISDIDKKKLIRAKDSNEYGLKVKFNPPGDMTNPGLIPTFIEIESTNGHPFYKFRYCNNCYVNERAKSTCTLDLCVNNNLEIGNINNWSLINLIKHVKDVQKLLRNEFGIKCNILAARLNYIEINSNFMVDDYRDYDQINKYIVHNCKFCGKTIKPSEDPDIANKTFMNFGYSKENNSVKAKVYNKTYTSKKNGVELCNDIVRLEIVLKNEATIKSHIGESTLCKINSSQIQDCYNKLVINPVLKAFTNYSNFEEKYLNKYYEEAKNHKKVWQSFCSLILHHEKSLELEPLLGLSYVYSLINKRYKKDRIRTRERFEKQAKLFAIDDLLQADQHVVFMISKLEDLQNGIINNEEIQFATRCTQPDN